MSADNRSWLSKHIYKVMFTMACIAAIIIATVFTVYFYNFNGALSNDQSLWGAFGDFIGGVLNPVLSFIAFIALLLTIILQSTELRYTREELRLTRKAQQKSGESISDQAKLMKDSATLSALSNIYNHYDENYGENDKSYILKHIASGHRSWAIRESFSIIDSAFEERRKMSVDNELIELVSLLNKPKQTVQYFRIIGRLTGSLIVDKRLYYENRILLWDIYELIRNHLDELHNKENSEVFIKFTSASKILVDKINNH